MPTLSLSTAMLALVVSAAPPPARPKGKRRVRDRPSTRGKLRS